MRNKVNLVYITGISFCGSSLLGFILGSSEDVFDAGELKFFNRLKIEGGEICSCGKNSLQCPFWKEIYKKEYQIYQMPSVFKKLKLILQIFFRIKIKENTTRCKDELDLVTDIKTKTEAHHILDISKSIWRLQHLLKCKEINVKIIYLQRSIEGNVSSFVKHGVGFWKGLFVYKLNNFLIRRFLKTNKLNYLYVNYDSLCKNPKNELKKIGSFLDVDYSDYIEKAKNREYHVPSGNQGTRKQFLENFQGLKYDDSWKKRLTKFQKFVLKNV